MEKTCKWTQDENGFYDTECGNKWEFMYDGPKENKVNFCMYCGKQVIEDKDNEEESKEEVQGKSV